MKILMAILGLFVWADLTWAADLNVIEVEQNKDQYIQITDVGQFQLHHLNGKRLRYQGDPEMVLDFFKELFGRFVSPIVSSYDMDLNSETGTIAIVVTISGNFGFHNYHYVVRRKN
ncbi:MAG: hypothetical protein H6626_00645 [Pseudobdellovibrionaceae bacterium]|nr:hypothetical protein [Bdellovibrionales bacterium]USN47631.1 MAG: hypothetical protein H6626_00645 [Pseudobdellovibrionaceae bacterium]